MFVVAHADKSPLTLQKRTLAPSQTSAERDKDATKIIPCHRFRRAEWRSGSALGSYKRAFVVMPSLASKSPKGPWFDPTPR